MGANKCFDMLLDSFRRWKGKNGPQVVVGPHKQKAAERDVAFRLRYLKPINGIENHPAGCIGNYTSDPDRRGEDITVYNEVNIKQYEEYEEERYRDLVSAVDCAPDPYMFTEQLTQSISILGCVVSTNHANGNDNTITAINARALRRFLALAEMGLSNAAGNNKVTWQDCATSNGTYANVGSTLTLNTNNSAGSLEIRADQLDSGTSFLQLNLLVAGGPAFGSIWALGGESSYKPASQFDSNNTNGVQNGGPTRTVN